MRATVHRNVQTGKDAYGNLLAPDWQAVAGSPIACWAFSRDKKVMADGNKAGVLADLRVAFPRAADVADGDRIVQIADRRGTVLYTGPMTILTLQRRRDHREAMVEIARGAVTG